MATTEWLVVHRELEYLRAAANCHPRHTINQQALRRRRQHAANRWIKYRQISHLRREP